MKKKKIAVLRSNPKDAALFRLLTSLSKVAEIECFLWDRQGDFTPAEDNGRIRYTPCRLRAGFYDLKTLLKLVLFQVWLFYKLMRSSFDVVHAIDLDTGIPGRLAAWLKGKKFVYHCLDPYYAILPERWPSILGSLARWIENRLISSADLFIITDFLRMPQHQGASPKNTVEIANVPFLPELSVPSSDTKTFTIGYLGSLIEGRNLDTVIEACGELQEQGVRLIIGSFGPMEKEIHAQAERWSNVTFRSWIPSYEKMLEEEASFDLFFHITDPKSESQRWISPNKLFEAMAFGKPIIVGQNTLAAQRVELFGNGIVVEYGSKEEFQKAILQLRENPEIEDEMGRKGQDEFQKNWRPEIMERRLLEAYERL